MKYKDLLDFFNGQASRELLRKIVREHFDINQNGRHTKIMNKNLPYFKIQNEFSIKTPRTLYAQGIKHNFQGYIKG